MEIPSKFKVNCSKERMNIYYFKLSRNDRKMLFSQWCKLLEKYVSVLLTGVESYSIEDNNLRDLKY